MAIVSHFANGIGVVNDHAKTWSVSGGSILQHGIVTIGITCSKHRALTNVLMNAYGLAFLVVDEIKFRKFNQIAFPIDDFIFHFAGTANNLIRGDAINFFRPGPHKINTTTGNDKRSVPIGAQIIQQFNMG